MNLYDHQKEILSLIKTHKKLFIESDRQSGISTVLQIYAMISARYHHKKIMVYTHNMRFGADWMDKMRQYTEDTHIDQTKNYVKFPDGGVILNKGFNDIFTGGMCGYRLDEIIFDECYNIHDRMFEVLHHIVPAMNTDYKIIYSLTGHEQIEIEGFFKYNKNDYKPKLLKRK
jgi:hypothetical protein